MDRKKLGQIGEKIALKYLQDKNYKILDKNYVSCLVSGPQRGEIDLIAQKDDKISFIEVKTLINRGQSSVFSPEAKVDRQKQRKLLRAAQEWLAEKKAPLDSKWQIDILAIKINSQKKTAKIGHFENVITDFGQE